LPGILTIAKKEFTDHVSDRTFLLCFATLLIIMTGSAFYQVQSYSGITVQPAWLQIPEYLHIYLTTQLSSLGALLAIALSLTSIQKERTEGSLKVLLSYPLYRDKIILGKLLAGALVLTLVATASTAISFSIMAYYMSIPLTIDFLLRVAAITAMGVALLTFFLCLGTAVSSVVRSTAASLMILLIAVFLLRGETLWTAIIVISRLLPGFSTISIPFYQGGSYAFTTAGYSIFRQYAWASPVEAYHHFSWNIFKFIPSLGSSTRLTFEGQLFKCIDLIAVQLAFTAIAFIVCYLVFTRGDVA
jgi:ABC-2 type transport system permease protein